MPETQATGRLPLVDVHAHVVLEGTFGHAGSYGPELD